MILNKCYLWAVMILIVSSCGNRVSIDNQCAKTLIGSGIFKENEQNALAVKLSEKPELDILDMLAFSSKAITIDLQQYEGQDLAEINKSVFSKVSKLLPELQFTQFTFDTAFTGYDPNNEPGERE